MECMEGSIVGHEQKDKSAEELCDDVRGRSVELSIEIASEFLRHRENMKIFASSNYTI